MTPPQIKDALIELDAGIKSADGARMLEAMERIDALVAALGATLDPRLAHFLERRSYAKALAWVASEGVAAIPLGTCAPRAEQG